MADRYDNEALLELCNKIDLLEYASKTMDFRPRGNGDFACSCPKHIDLTPSLIITPSKNLYHCLSCGAAGNILNWMMDYESMSFSNAVQKLVELCGVDIFRIHQSETMAFFKKMQRMSEPKRQLSAERKFLSESAINRYRDEAPQEWIDEGSETMAFFKKMQRMSEPKRQLSAERKFLSESAINRYRDEAPQEWIDEGIEPSVMKKYNIRIDDEGNRIVYPVYDKEFRLIGFKGRTRFKNYKEMGIQKYQNYQKIGTTDFFIGMKENQASILRNNKVIIFEGIKSGMKVEAWGYDFWLASETGYLNEGQVEILIQLGVKEVVIAYDNDVDFQKILNCTKKLRWFTNVYVVMDRRYKKNKLLGSKEEKRSPCDLGREVWETLYREKVKL